MELFAVLPIQKYSDKLIGINDSDNGQIGFVQRSYKNFFDKVLNYLSLSFLETRNVIGEAGEYYLKIKEQSFRANLIKLKWDVYLKRNSKEKTFLLEDETEVSTNLCMVYHKNNNEYIFKKDYFNSTYNVFIKDSNITCAEIKLEKLVPVNIRIAIKTDDLTIVELLGVYYIINLVY